VEENVTNREWTLNLWPHVGRLATGVGAILFGISLLVATRAAGQEVTPERLVHAGKEPQNWLTFFGNYRAWSYSPLNQITRDYCRWQAVSGGSKQRRFCYGRGDWEADLELRL
jgi:hypothetical protein